MLKEGSSEMAPALLRPWGAPYAAGCGLMSSRCAVGRALWFGPLRWLERLMFRTPVVYAFILASAVYHDHVWYRLRGRHIVRRWLAESPWGRLFATYQPRPDADTPPPE